MRVAWPHGLSNLTPALSKGEGAGLFQKILKYKRNI